MHRGFCQRTRSDNNEKVPADRCRMPLKSKQTAKSDAQEQVMVYKAKKFMSFSYDE